MQIVEISPILEQLFPREEIQHEVEEAWQIKNSQLTLLLLLSEDRTWLRILSPIASLNEVKSLLPQLLEDNFAATQEIRYATNKGVLWGVFHHRLESLTTEDLRQAIASLVALVEKGLSQPFNQLIEKQIIEIVKAAKIQGQSLEATYRTIDRFYQEGILGDINQDPTQREKFLAAWKYQLERLWSEVEV